MKHITSRTQHRSRQARRRALSRILSKIERRYCRAYDRAWALAGDLRDAIAREQERMMSYAGPAPYEAGQ